MSPIPVKGRRVVVTEFAESPEDALEHNMMIEEQLAPDPASLGAHEVLVEIRSAAVAWVDLLMTSGQYQHMPSPPYTPGMEFSGFVRATGGAVDCARLAPGNRVLADGMKVGPRSYGDYQAAGGFATFAVVPDDALLPIPATLSFDQAATLLQAYETAYHCLITRGRITAGESILINGASGLTGLAAVQIAKTQGATVIATGRSDDKLRLVAEQGADYVINIRDSDGGLRRFRDEVKHLTGGTGVNLVYDTVGGDTSVESLRCTAFEGRFLIVGWTSTPNVARGRGLRGAPNVNLLPTNIIQMKSISVLGCPTAIATAKDPSIRETRLKEILSWAEEEKISPFVSHTFPLERFNEALRARWDGEVTGGCVLHPQAS
ncbi:NADPH:quinone oxidoreductase family protein [Rhodococcus qingshengii]|uniref:NADPH:quinone oxidoreductase family protein n=1 Tax=Rhodococcus qingshengii TaxID=334542 RepID=UPI001ABFE409|nr:NADPH:quinone oxidoreductase family protein [Rhodococcus qingshengii]